MGRQKIFILILVFATLLLGIFLGYNLKASKDNTEPIDLNPLQKSCNYNGITYKSGESFRASDGCNTCSCEDGQVGCTLMACTKP